MDGESPMIDNNANHGYCNCNTNLSLFSDDQKARLPYKIARGACYYCGNTYKQLVGREAIELQDRIFWYRKLTNGNIPRTMEQLETFERDIREAVEVEL